jgi:hypothetical protein
MKYLRFWQDETDDRNLKISNAFGLGVFILVFPMATLDQTRSAVHSFFHTISQKAFVSNGLTSTTQY